MSNKKSKKNIKSQQFLIYTIIAMALLTLLAGILLYNENRSKASEAINVSNLSLQIDGLDCDGCPGKLKSVVRNIPGIMNYNLNVNNKMLDLTYNSDKMSILQIKEAIQSGGFTPQNPNGGDGLEILDYNIQFNYGN